MGFRYIGKIYYNGIIAGSKDRLPKTDIFDCHLSLILTRKWTNEILNNRDIYRHFRNSHSFDFLDLDEHIFYNMNLRVIRFPIKDNDYECILTILPDDEFSTEEIKELYALRWGIETSFRELKYAVGLTSLHSKKREYIIQEKIVDDSPLTVQIKHKTVKLEMFAFILIKPLLQEVGIEPTKHDY